MKTIMVDGARFTFTSKVVVLPEACWEGTKKNLVTFGRICAEDDNEDNAVLTMNRDPVTNFFIRAVPVPFEEHIAPNKMRGKDGRVYLLHEDKVYSALPKKNA